MALSNRPNASLPPHSYILGGNNTGAKSTSASDSGVAIRDDAEANTEQARIDDVDDNIYDKHDESLDSLAREIEQDMEDDDMPPAYTSALSRPDSPDSGFADIPTFEDSLQNEEPITWNGMESTGADNGNAGSSWTHVNWTSLGKATPAPVAMADSSRTSSTADNYVEVNAQDSRQNSVQADDDMVVVEKVD